MMQDKKTHQLVLGICSWLLSVKGIAIYSFIVAILLYVFCLFLGIHTTIHEIKDLPSTVYLAFIVSYAPVLVAAVIMKRNGDD